MNTILHVLNGDSTYNSFKETGLEGDVLIWREALSEGPLQENISSAAFWNDRSAWICKTYNDTPEHYREIFVNELGKMNQPYHEINLWFEFDLFCQINLLGAMMLLKQKADLTGPAIYLISPSTFPGKTTFKGMGELNGEELEYLYDNIRVQLSEMDFVLAEEAWKLYIADNITALKQWLSSTIYWGNLALLEAALEAHLKRLQVNESGLNYIEQRLFDIYNSGVRQRLAIYNVFWDTERIFGLGEIQLDTYLDRLKDNKYINFPDEH